MMGNAGNGSMKRGSLLMTGLVAPLVLSGCLGGGSSGSSGSDAPCSEFDCENMLQSLNENVMEPAVASFETEAEKLVTEARAYSKSLKDGNSYDSTEAQAAKSDAQDAWDSAMLVWQEIEMMQIGPLKDNSGALRDAVYSWPATSECGLDKEVVKANEDTDYDITTRTALRKGLNGIEYALFKDEFKESDGCSGDEIDTWNSLDKQEKSEYRAEYVAIAAEAVAARGSELNQKWTGDNGFAAELTNPGSDQSRFDSAQDAVNAVSDGLFYFEKQVKDIKIAEPLCGEKSNCPDSGETDIEKVENPYSNRSKEHINQNFIAFQTLFLGNREGETSRPGFDDFLDAINSDEDGETVSSLMETDIQEAIDDLARVEGTLADALQTTSGEDRVRDVWESAQDVTNRLKNDFLAVLGLSIPDAAAGDGD